MWPYRGIEAVDGATPMGHEYCGIVDEVGSAVTTARRGQFVVGSFWASDGTCELCRAGYHSACVHRTLMGTIGTQAEYAPIPLADGTLVTTADRDERATADTAARIEQFGVTALAVAWDVTSKRTGPVSPRPDHQHLRSPRPRRPQRRHRAPTTPLADIADNDWDRALDVNLRWSSCALSTRTPGSSKPVAAPSSTRLPAPASSASEAAAPAAPPRTATSGSSGARRSTTPRRASAAT
jgi:hypothetical protein